MVSRTKRALEGIVSELAQSQSQRSKEARFGQSSLRDRSPSQERRELEENMATLRLSSPEKEYSFEEDPEWAAEYAPDIFGQLTESEEKHHFFADYMEDQPELSPEERGIAVDWLVEVQTKWRLSTATLFLSVSLVDGYLALKEVKRDSLQLLVVAALFAAAKFEEIEPPELRRFVELTQQTCSKQDILTMEAKLLTAVEFRLCRPTAAHFADRYLQKHACEEVQGAVLAYLLQLALMEFSMLRYTPSEQVAAAALVSSRITGDQALQPCITRAAAPKREQRVVKCAVTLCRLLQAAPQSPWQAVRRKFIRSRNPEVAAAIRELET